LNSKLNFHVIKTDVIISQLLYGLFWQSISRYLFRMNNCRYLEDSSPSKGWWQNLCFRNMPARDQYSNSYLL